MPRTLTCGNNRAWQNCLRRAPASQGHLTGNKSPCKQGQKQGEALHGPRGASRHKGKSASKANEVKTSLGLMQPLCAHHMAPNLGLSHLPAVDRACSEFAGQTSTALTT